MKKYYLLPFIILSLSFCKKDNERKLVSETEYLIPFDSFPSHCYNLEKDEDEIDIDCGGSCSLCSEATPTCNLELNRALVNNNERLITNITQTQLPGGTIEVSFNAGSMPCEIRFKPDYSKLEPFQIINGWSLQEQEMNLQLFNPVYNYLVFDTYTNSGLGFINSSDSGQYEIYICDSKYSSNNYPISIHLLVP